METNLIKSQERKQLLPSKEEWELLKEQASMLAKEAGSFLPRGVDTPGKVMAIALIARDLDLPLMTALSSIHIVEGKPSMEAAMMRALIIERCNTAKIEFLKMDSKECVIRASRHGHPAKDFSFTIDEAKNAGLVNKDNWRKYPQDMLFARATGRMARAMFSDILKGVKYTNEEMQDTVIDITPKAGLAEVAQQMAEAEKEKKAKPVKKEKEIVAPINEAQVIEEIKTSEEQMRKLVVDNILAKKKNLNMPTVTLNSIISEHFPNKTPNSMTIEELNKIVVILEQHEAMMPNKGE